MPSFGDIFAPYASLFAADGLTQRKRLIRKAVCGCEGKGGRDRSSWQSYFTVILSRLDVLDNCLSWNLIEPDQKLGKGVSVFS